MCFAWLRFALPFFFYLSLALFLTPCDNKTKQNLRLDGSYDGGMVEEGVEGGGRSSSHKYQQQATLQTWQTSNAKYFDVFQWPG